MSKRIGIFVDVNNLYYCINKQFGDQFRLHYGRYLDKLGIEDFYRIQAYGNFANDTDNEFVNCLQNYGYDINHYQGKNHNIFICIDILKLSDRLDIVFLGSSDPDLIPLIDHLRQKGIKVIVYASRIPKEVRIACDEWIEVSLDLLIKKKQKTNETT